MRKLYLIFHGRFPGEKAASLFAAKSAEAFAGEGLDVEVIVPRRRGVRPEEAYAYFGVKKDFHIVELPIIDLFGVLPGKIAFFLNFIQFSIGCYLHLRRVAGGDDVIYSNEIAPLYAASFVSPNTFYEMHDFPESKLRLFARFLGRVKWLLVHNQWKAARVREVFHFPGDRILYEPNAVDIDAFDQRITTDEARRKLGLPLSKHVIVYTGHLYAWKGVDTLAAAAGMLGEDCLAVFVGGTDEDIAAFKARHLGIENILVVGHKRHAEIPLWQKAADILALPNSGKQAISLYYTSPMKLFEYMASKKPIVASDIPSIREIVNDRNAVLVPPDDALALAAAIKALIHDRARGEGLAAQAFRDVSEHTWQKRAARIVSFIR